MLLLLDGTGTQSSTEDIWYDTNRRAVGWVVRELGCEVVEARTYDVLGRLRTVVKSEPGRRVVTAYDYDDNGNRIAVRRGAAHVARLTYDTLDCRCGESVVNRGKGLREAIFDYDASWQLDTGDRGSGDEASTTSARYDGYGRATVIEALNGTTVSSPRRRWKRVASGGVWCRRRSCSRKWCRLTTR